MHVIVNSRISKFHQRVQAEILDRRNEGKEKVQMFLFKVN